MKYKIYSINPNLAVRKKVYIIGDIHDSTETLYELFERVQLTEEDIIVLLGDVVINYTGQMRDRLLKQELCDMKFTFFCIHGNHKNRLQNICSYQEMMWHSWRMGPRCIRE